jgi:hypothetical protein
LKTRFPGLKSGAGTDQASSLLKNTVSSVRRPTPWL